MNRHRNEGNAALCAADWPARHAHCQPIPSGSVSVDGYLGRRVDQNLDSLLEGLASPVVRYFEASVEGRQQDESEVVRLAADSDLYKWLEGASYAFARTGDARLRAAIDRLSALILRCQEADGYINAQKPHKDRFDEKVCHDLYIAGHFFEAAVAHHRATGEPDLLDAARRWADFLIKAHEDGHPYFKGGGMREHSEYELGLLRLYRETGEEAYLEFSIALATELNHVGPTLAEVKAGGGLHAVRVGYLLASLADLYLETGRNDLLRHLVSLWDEIVDSRMYVTGAVASRGESFSPEPFDLPHTCLANRDRSLGETCAAIAFILFSWRMHAITGESRYVDVIENTLYNHVFGAVSLDGMGTFYYNPMRMVGDLSKHTDHWHRPATSRCMLPHVNRTSCCITNLWRFFGALPEYIFSFDRNGVIINLYTNSAVNHALPDGRRIALTVETKYPHKGEVTIRFSGEDLTPFNLNLRIPGWCSAATAKWPDGEKRSVGGGRAVEIDRIWSNGDTVHLALDMPVRMIAPDPRVSADTGQVVFARGPLVYCLEEEDVSFPVERASVSLDQAEVAEAVKAEWLPGLLGGIHMLRLPGLVDGEPVELKLVPWSVRANRSENSRWVVYLPQSEEPA